MKAKEAFMKTYRTPGGARSFWIMVGGCVLAILLPILLKNSSVGMFISFVPALLAIIYGQQFTGTFGQYMAEDSEQDKR